MVIPMMEENRHPTRSSLFRDLRQFAMTSGKRAHSPDGSPGDRPAVCILFLSSVDCVALNSVILETPLTCYW